MGICQSTNKHHEKSVKSNNINNEIEIIPSLFKVEVQSNNIEENKESSELTKVAKLKKINSNLEYKDKDNESILNEVDTVFINLIVELDQHYFIINDPLQEDKVEISEKKNNYEFHKFIEDFNENIIEEQINNFILENVNFYVRSKGDLNYLIGKLKDCAPGSDDNFKYYISVQ